jgi:hypothetical protein
MPGARDALAELERRGYEVVIFSTRPAPQIRRWLMDHGFGLFPVTNEKLPAVAIIDDRAIHHIDWAGSLSELARRYPPAPFGVVGSSQTPGST